MELINSIIQKLENPFNWIIITMSSFFSFIFAYVYDITINHENTFLSVIVVVLVDGLFGVLKGIKTEGFKTYKAIKILRTLIVWVVFLGTVLTVEKGFDGMNWLSEVIITPFMVFQIISALKNASMAGLIEAPLLNEILDKIDRHKGTRNK
jgi:hypothetical protein